MAYTLGCVVHRWRTRWDVLYTDGVHVGLCFTQVAYTLGCVVLNNSENQDKLHDEPGFKFDILLHLLATADEVCLLRHPISVLVIG